MKNCLICLSIIFITASCKQPTTDTNIIDLSVDKEAAKSLRIRYQPPMFRYPPLVKIARIQGKVVIQATIDQNGEPISVKELSGPSELVDVSKEYASKFKYFPLIISGEPRSFKTNITCTFKLDLDSRPPKEGQ